MTDMDSYDTVGSFSDYSDKQSTNTEKISNQPRLEMSRTKVPNTNKLIPCYLEQFSMTPKIAELRVAYDAPTNQTTYTYTICWADKENRRENYKMCTSSSVSSISTSSASEKQCSAESTTKYTVPPVMAVCDGPCKKAIPSNKLNTLGRCGHYLCDACYGIVTNSDGTKGCSAFVCNWKGKSKNEALIAYEKEIVQKQRKRAREMMKRGVDVKIASSFSQTRITTNQSTTGDETSRYDRLSDTEFEDDTSSKTGTITLIENDSLKSATPDIFPSETEMIIAKLIIIEKNSYNAILRIHKQIETATSIKLKKAISSMLADQKRDASEYIKFGTLYYVECQSNGPKKLKKVNKDNLGKLHLYDIPLIRDNLYFVLDMIGYIRNRPVQITLDYDE